MGSDLDKFRRKKRTFIDLVKNIIPLPLLSSLLTAIIFFSVVSAAVFYFKLHTVNSFFNFPKLSLQAVKVTSNTNLKHEVIGFLPSWVVAKNTKVDPKNLSQIIYFGLGVNKKGELIKFNEQNKAVSEWEYFDSEYMKNLIKISHSSQIKVLVALKNFDNENIDNLISNQTSVNSLIMDLQKLIREYQLDGINIDFEYVTDSNFPTFKYLNKFFTSLNTALKKDNPNLIISADINVTALEKDGAYDVVKIGELVDQLIVMGYDFSRPESSNAGPVSPLYSANDESPSIDRSIQSLSGRIHMEKVILAVPFYGYEWQTLNSNYKSPTIENTGALATYERVSQLINNRRDIKRNWDEQTQTPWIIYGQSGAIKQIYYEDAKSLSKKLEFAQKKKLGGIAVWALGYEGEGTELWKSIFKYSH